MKAQRILTRFILVLLMLLGSSSDVHAQVSKTSCFISLPRINFLFVGGGNCMADTDCNSAASGGFCNLGPNSCICINGFTGANCQTAPTSPSGNGSGSSLAMLTSNNAVLLLTLGAFFFIFLKKERSREEENQILDYALYREYLHHS
ncbi:uncharacterized protein LOC133204983 [Saccostrea echinata]|uniref:uncharacterized protein LOC133204983 n=1 Tax=Saccostrea echinata TaxID=191078 RepID=UPI002A821DBC|nr:uncharacterized protein LOC133204983 [Saccostrea echinata]